MSGRPPPDPRLHEILEAILRIARQEFTARAPVSSAEDTVDAIATALNMLAEELDVEVASRRDLEDAYARLQNTQAQLVHAGKLAAIGQLASGVAHEINNPAMGVEVMLEIMERACRDMQRATSRDRLDMDEINAIFGRVRPAIADAREAIGRIRSVTGDLRTFARIDDDSIEPVDVEETVRVSCRLTAPLLRQRGRLELVLGDVPPVLGNRGRLGQVVTNLVVNAAQALPEHGVEAETVRVTTSVEAGDVVITVEDSGPGVPDHLRERIFEPFYTSKPADEGTGLGLPLIQRIIDGHNGTITVSTSPLGGARFEVRLSAATDTAVTAAPPAAPVETNTGTRVLIVDDEPIIVRLLESLLEDECELVTAAGGVEAIDLLRGGLEVDLIVCDLHMPGADGIDVYRAVEAERPELVPRFVFSTGGTTSQRSREFVATVKPRMLAKPFPASELLELIAAARRSP